MHATFPNAILAGDVCPYHRKMQRTLYARNEFFVPVEHADVIRLHLGNFDRIVSMKCLLVGCFELVAVQS